MSREAKGIRLWLRPPRGTRPAMWIIRDGEKQISTGCSIADRASAEKRLSEYIAAKYEAPRRQRDIAEISLSDVIAIYLTDVAAHRTNVKAIAQSAERLLGFWGSKTLADVNGYSCRSYASYRGNQGGSRRELQNLSAAIQHHHREGYHREAVLVTLPPKGPPRERWLTRSEIARLVWTAWRARERQRGRLNGRKTAQHIARAILFAYYTASRIGDVLRASYVDGIGRSYIDLERGIFYRLPRGKTATNKRQPPVAMPKRLLAHARRWKRLNICHQFVVEWEALPVKSIKTGFASVCAAAGIEGATPHTLRHSRVTHQMQRGVTTWEVAGFAGMSEKMVRDVYGHHSPEHLRGAAEAR